MRSDRRTLVLLGVIVLFLIVSVTFRSYFLYGARLLTGSVSIDKTEMLSTTDENDSATLGVWSTKFLGPVANGNRDVQLGFTLTKMSEDWNRESAEGKEAIGILEEFCKQNPSDLPSRAHLLRLAINLYSLDKIRDKALLTAQAERLATIAHECSVKEPMNWYWREREVHFLTLLKKDEEAIEKFTAQPFPNTFSDYVEDDIKVRQAYIEACYTDLPASNNISTWAGTIFPHLSSFRTFEEFSKRPNTELALRTAEIEFGRAMVRSCPNRITALVGLRYIRYGLWNSSKFGYKKNLSNNLREEARIKPVYLAARSDSDWQSAKRIATNETIMNTAFLDIAEDYRGLYITQLGPVFIGAGIITSLVGFGFFLLSRTKKELIKNDLARWIALAIGLLLATAALNKYRYFVHYSLQSTALYLVIVGMAIGAMILIRKSDTIQKKIFYVLLILLSVAIGFAVPPCQVATFMILLAFLVQKGKMPLSPWVSALLVFLIAYHACLFAAFNTSHLEGIIALFFGCLGIILSSPRQLEIQQPRMAGVMVGLVASLVGIVLMSYYDRSIVTFIQTEQANVQKIKRDYEDI